jgi:polyisoprenyl-teichoic acid--peptidoglycan teichoic acid transferase
MPLRGSPGVPRDERCYPAPVTDDSADTVRSATPSRRSRYVPAVLDAILPGLGHVVAGRRLLGAIFLTPSILALLAALYIVVTTSGPRLVATLLESEVIWGLLAFQGVLLVWRLLAVGSSLFAGGLPRLGRGDILPVALLLFLIIAPQAYAGYATEIARETADEVFVEPSLTAILPSQEPESDPSLEPAAPSPSGLPSASPSPSPVPVDPRITGVIVGVDAGVGRNTYGTDTMIVVSMDPATETVSMISVPRDMVDVPLADGRTYRGKINGLVSFVRHHPKQFPQNDGTGFDVLMGALGKLLDVKIDYYAAVTLGGFVQVVNTLGGVDVNVAHAFCDPRYDEYGFTRGFAISAGKHHLTGNQALAYARVRKAAGESDFTRAARQQEVLSGIRDRVVKGGFINDPIGLLKAVGQTVTTNVPRKLLPDLADAASNIGRDGTYRAVITHPLVGSGNDARGSIQIPNLKKIRALAADLFPTDGTLPKKTYAVPKGSTKAASGSGVSGCAPRPTARPTPKPTPKPTKKPTPKPTASATPSLPVEPSASGETP